MLNDAWARFGLAQILAGIGSLRQRGLLQAILYSRLLFPCAKLSLAHQAQGTWLAQACGLEPTESFHEDDLYNAMDQLNGQWVSLEKQLYRRAFPQAVRLVLYDLTSVYFEGKGPEHLAAYGHSRDHRSDRPQIVLAVATDTEGLPLHVSVLRGNRNDTKTLQGLLQWERKTQLIAQEAQQDGWYLLHTNEPVAQCTGAQVLGHYKGLLDVKEAFCQLKSYLEVRPMHHRRSDRVINHARLCFLAYWLSARLGGEWRAKGGTEEVPRVLRHLQTIRLGRLQMGKDIYRTVMTEVPKSLNEQIQKLGMASLFAAPPNR